MFADTATAAPSCSYDSQQLYRGHATTYIHPAANPAIGDYIGTTQHTLFYLRCKFDSLGSMDWTTPSWNVISNPTAGITSTGLSVFFAESNAQEDTKPVLATPALESLGLGFVGVVEVLYDSVNGYHAESFIPLGGSPKTVYPVNQFGGYQFTVSMPFDWRNPADHFDVKVAIHVYYRFVKINDNFNTLSATPVTHSIAPFVMGAVSVR